MIIVGNTFPRPFLKNSRSPTVHRAVVASVYDSVLLTLKNTHHNFPKKHNFNPKSADVGAVKIAMICYVAAMVVIPALIR